MAYIRWRLEKEGFDPIEAASYPYFPRSSYTLHAAGSSPPGMVWVPAGQRTISDKPVDLAGFWLDKFEVTNREFKRFVDAGRYRKREYWKQPFVKNGREISWEDGMRELVDKAGQPGPSTWELGTYAEGEDDYPVRGVSWHEAAAFAEFAGKSLPTVHHWMQATDQYGPPAVLELSNCDGQGPAPVAQSRPRAIRHLRHGGERQGVVLEPFRRQAPTLGGACNEAVYMYRQQHAQSPFDRAEIYGFRCAKYVAPIAEELTAPIERIWRDYAREKPVDDAAFRLIESIYAYDHTDLDATTEPLESGSPHWRKAKITFNAATATSE
jgi:hypothetical protein